MPPKRRSQSGWRDTTIWGDLAVVDEDGFVSIQDRKRTLSSLAGRTSPSIELEDTLFEHVVVSDVAVIPRPTTSGARPRRRSWSRSGDPDDAGATPEELKAFVRERVADYKTPGEVEFVAELPTTATGKIQKYELREREWDEEDRMVGEG